MYLLGISALYHDSAAALIRDGEIVAAAQEERFTRVRHDRSIPANAIAWCLAEAGIGHADLEAVCYYDNPLLALDRMLCNAVEESPDNGALLEKSFLPFFREKLWIHKKLGKAVGSLGRRGKLLVVPHHLSHAASAFLPSPFDDAAVLTVDGVGEWGTTALFDASDGTGGAELRLLRQIDYPHSLGLLYSAITYFCGFKVNSGEYKLMGLAPYGSPRYADLIRDRLVEVGADGSFRLNLEYFTFQNSDRMTGPAMEELFGGARRIPESRISRREMDIAASIQVVTEEIMLRLAADAKRLTGRGRLCLAGGVALNCVSNGRLRRESAFDGIWVQPASGDAGGALGCALYAGVRLYGFKRPAVPPGRDRQKGSYLGPRHSSSSIAEYLDSVHARYERVPDADALADALAERLAGGAAAGLFRGRMEFGPRALGARSIIADPRSADTQSRLNLKIKFRESFRPFAPAVLAERVSDYFDAGVAGDSDAYMLFTAPVAAARRRPFDLESALEKNDGDMLRTVGIPRSDIPAVTHVDLSARLQTVDGIENPFFHRTLSAFERLTGCAVLVNTSFNVRGEPIVNTPEDAYACFMTTGLDVLVLEDCILEKSGQPEFTGRDRRNDYEPD